jgi:hypothetical protein
VTGRQSFDARRIAAAARWHAGCVRKVQGNKTGRTIMRPRTLLAALATLLLASPSACSRNGDDSQAGNNVQQPTAAPPAGAQATPTATGDTAPPPRGFNCPVTEGVNVAVADTDSGAMLTFTTDGDVDALRRRAHHMAEMYGVHRGRRGMMWRHRRGGMGPGPRGGPGMAGAGPRGPGMAGAGPRGGRGMMRGAGPMPAANATVEEITGGARILLTPKNPADLQALRDHVHQHHQRMSSGACWRLQQAPTDSGGEG